MQRPVLAIGEILIDFIASDQAVSLESASSFLARPGGAPANVAVALVRLGVPSAFCGLVGNDAFGRRLRQVLTEEGVDVSRLETTTAAETTVAFAWTDRAGRGQFWLPRRAAADRFLAPDQIERGGIGDVAAICAGSVSLAAEPSRSAILRAVELANAAGVPVCFDVNLRPAIWENPGEAAAICRPIFERATLLKLSRDDATALFGAGLEPEQIIVTMASGMPALRALVLTDGAAGCWYTISEAGAAPGPVRHVPVLPVQAVESTGAGDAFFAALVARMVARQWSSPELVDLRFATAAGAFATTKHGAIASLPTTAEVMALLAAAE